MMYLNWNALVTTPTEIIRFLFYLSNYTHNFTRLIDEANGYALTCMTIAETCFFPYSSIALAMIFYTLELHGFFTFKQGIQRLIISYQIAFDIEESTFCKTVFESYLAGAAPSGSG